MNLPCARLIAEPMEERILHSADVAPLLLGGAAADALLQQPLQWTGSDASVQRSEIVFVDAGLPDAESLIADLQAQRDAGRPIQIILIGAGQDGIALISETLAGRSDISAVHVLAHGSDGRMQLGAATLDGQTLMQRAGEVAGWATALTADADLLLYGCDVALTALGRQFVNDLAALTGADVAASTDLTGATAQGGNWALEFGTGRIEAAGVIGLQAQQAWTGTLAVTQSGVSSTVSVGTVSSVNFSHSINAGSDRLLMVELAIGGGVGAASVSYNGSALTFVVGQTASSNNTRVELWYMVAPPVGSGTVSVVLPAGSMQGIVAGASTFYGVNQATPLGTPATALADTTLPSVTVSAAIGDLVVDMVGSNRVLSSVVGGGQNELFNQKQGSANSDIWGVSSTEPGAASVVMSHSVTPDGGGAPRWAAVAVAVKQVSTPVVINAFQDTYITSGSTSNYGASTSLVVDRSGGSDLGDQRALLQFDFSSIPAGATITSASLQMQATANGGAFNINVHNLTEAWVQGSASGGAGVANWNQRLPGTNWTSGGGSYDPTAVATLNTAAVGQHSWNLTSLVQAWVAGTTANHGIIIGSPDSGTTTITYDSSEGATPPRLVISYTLTNAAPVVTATGSALAYTENQAATAIDPGLTVSDADSATLAGATVSISANYANGQDVLAFTNQLGITGSWNAGTGVLTLSGTTTVANYQTALRSITYANGSDDPSTLARTISFVVNDGIAPSIAATRTVNVAAVNDAPVLTTSGGALAYSENQAATAIDSGLTVSDADNTNLTGATVTISANYANGQDVLAFTNQLGITGSWNAGTGVLTLSGTTTVANYQTALRAVTYANSSDNPSTLARTIAFVVNDGTAPSIAATRTVSVTAVNDAPRGSDAALSADKNGSRTLVRADFGYSDAVGESNAFASVLIQLPSAGTVRLSGTAIVVPTEVTVAQLDAGLLSFVPTSGATGSPYATIQFQVRDDGGTANGGIDLDPVPRTLTMNVVNRAPAITSNGGGGSAGVNVPENTTAVTTVVATDADGDVRVYSIAGGVDAARFAIDASTGVLRFVVPPNFEAPTDVGANNIYDVIVRASDGSLFADQAIAVTVGNVTEALLTTGEQRVNTVISGTQETSANDRGSPRAVAMSPAGDYVVVWSSQNQDGSGWGVYGQRHDKTGAKLGGEIAVNQFTAGDQVWATVAMDVSGRFVVSWTSANQDGTAQSIYARLFHASGTANGGEFRVNTTATGSQYNSSVAMDANGNFVVVWQGNGPGDGDGIFGRRFNADGTAIDATEFRVNTDLARAHYDASVSMNASGAFAVTWDNNAGVQLRRYDSSGAALGGEINVDNGASAGNGSIAIADDGSLAVVWRETLLDQGVYLQRYSSVGAPVGAAVLVNATIVFNQTNPSIAMDGAGNFIVAWEGNGPGDSSGVFGQKYNSAGNTVGGEFRINTTTTGTQAKVSLAMLDLNNFVAVWSGQGPVDTSGVFARQYGTLSFAPVITSNGGGETAAIEIAENTTAVTTVTATDADLPAQTLTYSIVGGDDAAKFTIGGSTGVLSFIIAPGFEVRGDVGADNVYDVIVQASDGTLTATQAIAVTVGNVNDNAPINNVPGAQLTAKDTVLVFSAAGGNAISVADADNATTPLKLSLVASGGLLALSGTSGLTFSSGTGAGDASMIFTGSVADINAALNGLRFTPQAGSTGAASLQIISDDQGGGGGAALTDTDLISISVADASLWLSTDGGTTSSAGSGGLSWNQGQVVNFGNPNLALGAGTTSGTFSAVFNANVLAADGNVDVNGLHFVSHAVTVGTTNPVALQAGDVLFTVESNETFGGLAVSKRDLVLFRPSTPGNYASGSFQIVLRNPGGTGNDIRDFALVETAVTVGGTSLQAGDFLLVLSSAGYDRDVSLFRPTTMGTDPTGGTLSLLINGSSAGINTGGNQIWGLELVQQPITLGGVSLAAGSLLVSLDGAAAAGTNALAVQQGDIFALNVTSTGVGSSATATMVLRSADLGLSGGAERLDAIAIAQRASAAPLVMLDGGALAYTEKAAPAPIAPTASVTDSDSTQFGGGSLSIYLSNNASADDRLAIRDQGVGAGQIGVAGSDVTFGGLIIGSFSGGSDGSTPLVISLNANASTAATQALLRNITFANVSSAPSILPRTVSVVLSDGNGGVSAVASRVVNVSAVNDAPITAPASAVGAEDSLLPITLTGSDVDGTVASFTVSALPTTGTLYLDAARTTVVLAGTAYAASGNALTLYFDPTLNWNGSTGFNFIATDDLGLNSVAAAASLTVTPVNDAPVAAAASATGAEDSLLPITLTGSDVDGTVASFTVTALPANGTLYLDAARTLPVLVGTALAASGNALTLYFDPLGDWNGGSSFNFYATDNLGLVGNTAAASLTIAAANDAPVLAAAIAAQAATQDAGFSFGVPVGSFTDIDSGDSLSYSASLASGVALPAWLSFNAATQTFTGTPANADVGAIVIRVTATDTSNATAFGDFTLTVANVNDAPVLAAAITNPTATEDAAFSFVLPAGAFTDVDAGDTLSYTASLASGAALPTWLSFNAATQTFSGTPTNADVGAIIVRVTATDTSNATAFGDFTLTVANVNDAPVLAAAITNPTATEDVAFSFALPVGTFTDIDAGDTLGYSASLASGAALPTWLSFNAATQTFTGTPANADVGAIIVRVTATDTSNATAFGDFTLTIANVNDAPVLAAAITNPTATEDVAFSFALPAGTFTDIDAGDTLSYSASLASGAALPTWLSFNAATQAFTGTPANADVGAIVVRVTATDTSNATAFGDFTLTVANVNDAPVLANPLADLAALTGNEVRFQIPAATFLDVDAGDSLQYSATLADGSALPAWLAFDPATRSFVGTPQVADIGSVLIRVIAADATGATAQALFAISVAIPEPAPVLVIVDDAPVPLPVAISEPALAATPSAAPAAAAAKPAADSAAPAQAASEQQGEFVQGSSAGYEAAAETVRSGGLVAVAAEQPGSRADAVLADALVPQFTDITLAPLLQLLHSDEMLRRLEEMQRQLLEQTDSRNAIVASTIAVTSGLSIGYVVWLVRGGVLVSSMLSALPAWQLIDPLPVLASAGAVAGRRGKAAADEAEIEKLFDRRAGSKPLAPPSPDAGAVNKKTSKELRP